MLLYKQITKIDKTKLSQDLQRFLKEDIPRLDLTTEQTISSNNKCAFFITLARIIKINLSVYGIPRNNQIHNYNPWIRDSICYYRNCFFVFCNFQEG